MRFLVVAQFSRVKFPALKGFRRDEGDMLRKNCLLIPYELELIEANPPPKLQVKMPRGLKTGPPPYLNIGALLVCNFALPPLMSRQAAWRLWELFSLRGPFMKAVRC